MKRKYKNLIAQAQYDECFNHGADDFMRNRGGSIQNAFMDGYKGLEKTMIKTSYAYYAFMAGKDRKVAERDGKINPAKVKDKRLLDVR